MKLRHPQTEPYGAPRVARDPHDPVPVSGRSPAVPGAHFAGRDTKPTGGRKGRRRG